MGCLRERFLTLTHLPILSDVDGVDGALPAASVQFSLPVHLGPFPQHQRRGSPGELNYIFMWPPWHDWCNIWARGQWVWGRHFASITFSELVKQSRTSCASSGLPAKGLMGHDGPWWHYLMSRKQATASICLRIRQSICYWTGSYQRDKRRYPVAKS